MSSIPHDLDQRDHAAVRGYILNWQNANPDKVPPIDWYQSWKMYLDQLRKHVWMRDYCDEEHGPGQYCLVCDDPDRAHNQARAGHPDFYDPAKSEEYKQFLIRFAKKQDEDFLYGGSKPRAGE